MHTFGAQIVYSTITRKDYNSRKIIKKYVELEALINNSDIINTPSDDIVNNNALRNRLIDETITGADFDTKYLEPMFIDKPFINLPNNCKYKVLCSAHVGEIITAVLQECIRIYVKT